MMYASCPAALIAMSGTARIPFDCAVPLTLFCQVGCEYTTLAPPPEAQSPDPPDTAPLSFQTFSGM